MTIQNHIKNFKNQPIVPYLTRHRRDYVFDSCILDKLSCEDLFTFAKTLEADSKDKTIYIGEAAQIIYKNYTAAFAIVKERNANVALKRDITDTAAILAL